MSGPDNADRAAWAETAVEAFLSVCKTDDCDVIGDLICDLLHLAASDPERYGDPLTMHGRGLYNFEAEQAEEACPEECDREGCESTSFTQSEECGPWVCDSCGYVHGGAPCANSPAPEDGESDGDHAFNTNGVCACGLKDKRG